MDVESVGVIASAALGAIVGSFLNVVIFRLPRGLSVSSPRWSFCPQCERRIEPRYNIPIMGWLTLRGRCRQCHAPISIIYPAVEAATSLVFVMLWDALVIARTVPGSGGLAQFWPVIFAYFFLFAALLASAAMDIESYTIHIQILLIAMAVGVLAHAAISFPLSVINAPQAYLLPPAVCITSLAMGAAWLVSTSVIRWRRDPSCANEPPQVPNGVPSHPLQNITPDPVQPCSADGARLHATDQPWRFQPLPVLLLVAVVAALAAWQLTAPTWRLASINIPAEGQRAFLATAVLLLMLILASLVHRQADHQIMEDLERERPQARAMALREFLSFFPALAAGFLVLVWLRHAGTLNATWQDTLSIVSARLPWPTYCLGGIYSLSSAILSAAMGWAVRILGTLAFGKEAFGSGDIYILAAIGAVGGLWLVVVGFLLAAILALVGVLATSFRKTSRAIPFGPWLALGAFVGLWLERPIITVFGPAFGWLLWGLLGGHSSWPGGE